MRLVDRVAIVTGAQQGIGEAVARTFAREGAAVVVNYLDDPHAAQSLVREIEHLGTRAVAVPGVVQPEPDLQPGPCRCPCPPAG